MPGMDYFHNSKSHWLNALRGYFNDLDWTVDNINDQDKTKFDNIYTWMKVNWKYRKFKGQSIVLRYEIFKRNLGLQLKRKNSHKDAYIERYEKTRIYLSESLVEYDGAQFWSQEDWICQYYAGGKPDPRMRCKLGW